MSIIFEKVRPIGANPKRKYWFISKTIHTVALSMKGPHLVIQKLLTNHGRVEKCSGLRSMKFKTCRQFVPMKVHPKVKYPVPVGILLMQNENQTLNHSFFSAYPKICTPFALNDKLFCKDTETIVSYLIGLKIWQNHYFWSFTIILPPIPKKQGTWNKENRYTRFVKFHPFQIAFSTICLEK